MTVGHYKGSCQCGAVAYEVEVDISEPVACNCSRCRRLGSLLAFAPRSAFTLVKGEEATSEYLFNKRVIHHRFCATCGIESFALGTGPDGTEMVAVNVNCLDGVDARSLPYRTVDGAAR
jgi:hypothetical protein